MKDIKDIPKENLEIERKFLLKNVPNFSKKDINRFHIHQIYVEIDGEINRFRMAEELVDDFSVDVDVDYVKCVKKPISVGVFEEIEECISKDVFDEMSKKDHRHISKTRIVYEENGLKWEIDVYHSMKLVTLEVELDDIEQKISIPNFIDDLVITELTGKKEFSNYNLSLKN